MLVLDKISSENSSFEDWIIFLMMILLIMQRHDQIVDVLYD